MKITGSDLQSQLSVYQNTQVQEKNEETARSQKSASPISLQDRVALSGRGKMIADAQRAMASVPDVREALVTKIQNELKNGTYRVDSQKAAEGMLKEAFTNQAAMV